MNLRWLLALFLFQAAALAHPVAQGAMDVLVERDRVHVQARVSVEEAFVAEGFAAQGVAENHDAIWSRHGAYLLKHLHISADGTPLVGEVVEMTPPPNTAPTSRITYELAYALTTPPREITLRQDLLNEFEFAPGNPWEATFVTTLGQQGRTAEGGLLFTHKEPLRIVCDWTLPVEAAAPPRVDRGRMFGEYLHHGVMHILTGYDHLLFMAALVLAVTTLWDLVKVVTAFTVAHTVTLTLSVLDVVRLPEHIVEPMIAASIVVVALQNIFWPEQARGWTRLAVAFGFGLFHGLGFAGGLLEAMTGLPGLAVATAIVAFSIGVELGHQVIVLPLYLALLPFRRRAEPRERTVLPVVRAASALVSFAGMYYLVAALR